MDFEIENHVLIRYKNPRDEEIKIPEDIIEIGDFAFENCWSLMRIQLPKGLQKIGKCAFSGCLSLREIHIPASVKEIGERAFCDTSLIISEQNPHFITKNGALYTKDMKKLLSYYQDMSEIDFCIPEGVEEIGAFAFEDHAFTNIMIPASVTKIGRRAFQLVQSMTLAEDHPCFVIHDGVLYTRDMTRLIYCIVKDQKEFSIPETVHSVDAFAFQNCFAMEKISIPNNITKIGNFAFWCQNLEQIQHQNKIFHISELFSLLKQHSFTDHVFWNNDLSQDAEEYTRNEEQFMPNALMKIKCINAVIQIAVNRNFEFSCPLRLKYDIMTRMQEDPKSAAYLIYHFVEMLPFALHGTDHREFMQNLLNEGKLIAKENIDSLIRYFIDQKEYEIQVMLTDYKHQHFDYQEDIYKKFGLD